MKKSKHKYKPRASCDACGRPYGDENGFPDLIIEDWAWKEISPNGNEGGLLCPCCILENLEDMNIRCFGSFMSGKIKSVTPDRLELIRKLEKLNNIK